MTSFIKLHYCEPLSGGTRKYRDQWDPGGVRTGAAGGSVGDYLLFYIIGSHF